MSEVSDRTTRQLELIELLTQTKQSLSGTLLAKRLGVTRQVVVHEIALLRALGYPILATPKGYVLQSESVDKKSLLTVSHTPDQTAEELYIFVDCGVKVIDVRVEHRVYGEIAASLYLASRRDVDHFLAKMNKHAAPLLSTLTQGFHAHTVEFQHDEQLADVITRLESIGIKVIHE
jgi:uncharacterized protein